jgi:hypothetical protein
VPAQIGTTKGTGGDVLILEEAAYCDEGFFYETVAPILSIGSASLVAISTLTSEINFYTRLIQMVDPATERPLFAIRCIELCCDRCKEEGKQAECVHMLHLVPMWQSEERHRKLKIMMQDRPDLIQSELAGLAFDSLQQVFRKSDIAIAMSLKPLPTENNPTIFMVIDPAAGGPQSDYAIVSILRHRGSITVRLSTHNYATDHASWQLVTNMHAVHSLLLMKLLTKCLLRFMKKFANFCCCASVSLAIILSLVVVSMLSKTKNIQRMSAKETCSDRHWITARTVEFSGAIPYRTQMFCMLCSQKSCKYFWLTGMSNLGIRCGRCSLSPSWCANFCLLAV